MKRPLAIALTIVIFAAVAVCFLRPAPIEEGVYTCFKPARVKLTGENAKGFELTYSGASSAADGLLPATLFTVASRDGGYYTLSYIKWLPRAHDYNGVFGKVEKMGADGWQPYFNLELQLGWYAMFSPNDVERCLVTPDDALSFACTLPLWEAGRYRATIVLREYDIEQKCSGDGVYELNFEYNIPERSGGAMDVAYAVLETDERICDGETVGLLKLCLLANGNARYVQPDSIRFERDGITDGLSVSTVNGTADILMESYVSQYNSISAHPSAFYADGVEVDEESRLSVVTLPAMVLRGWERGEEYRLSMTFTENPDGSGEQYTLTLRLRFDE